MSGVTYTANVLGQLSTLDLQGLLNLFLAIVAAALLATPVQAVLEGLIASALPTYLLFVKPFLPSAISSLLGGIAVHLGVAPQDALAGAAALASFTHWVNEQPWAVDLEKKYPQIGKLAQDLDTTQKQANPISKIPAVLLAIGLAMALAGKAEASVLEFQVPISPTAGSSYISNTFVLSPTVLKYDSGNLNADILGYLGAQSTFQWGPNYGLGVTIGVLGQGVSASNVPTAGKLAGGIVADFTGCEGGVVWANDGARLILTHLF